MPVVVRRVKTSTRLKHTAKPLRSLPSISAEMLTVAVCSHADRGTCVDGVSSHSGDYDPGFRETDIDGDKVCEILDDCDACPVVRAVETRYV